MERKGHYLKGATRPRVPSVIFTATVTPRLTSEGAARHITISSFGTAHVTVTKRYHGRWTAPEVVRVSSGDAMREWMTSRASRHRTNWVVCPVASDVLTLAGWWPWMEEQGVIWRGERVNSPLAWAVPEGADPVDISRLILRGTPDIIRYRHAGLTWQWVSGLQYLPDGTGELGDETPGGAEHVRTDQGRCLTPQDWSASEALRWSRAMRRILDWWAEHSRAPWGATVGQCAVSMLRTYAPPRVLCSHQDTDAHELERAASFGGRASVWYVGPISPAPAAEGDQEQPGDPVPRAHEIGPITQWDIRSMYPTLLRDHSFPVRLIGYEGGENPERIVGLARSFGIICRATLDTRSAEYPKRAGDRVAYPVGRFTTTLTGPELERAHADGEVVRCLGAAVYAMGCPFARFAGQLIDMRTSAAAAGSHSMTRWLKLIANSLAGKLAQRTGGWIRSPEMDQPGKWGQHHAIDADRRLLTRYRYIAGIAWKWDDDVDRAGPFAAAFCYLTAYGRLMMRGLRESLPARSVVSQDTDGLWTLESGTAALDSGCVSTLPGRASLRRVCTATSGRWYGPRHYCVDGKWTLAGFSDATMDQDGRTVWDRVNSSIWAAREQAAPTETRCAIRQSLLRFDLSGGIFGIDGWVAPPRVRRGKGE